MSRFARLLPILVVLLGCVCLPSCVDLEGNDGGDDFRTDDDTDDDSPYPQYLVIGGGLSETLSVLRIEEGPVFTLFNNTAPTGNSINDTVVVGDLLFAVCSLSNSVVVYDQDLDVRREVSVGAGANPMNIAFVDDHHAWVTALQTNDLRLLDLAAGTPNAERLQRVVALPSGDELPKDPGVDASWARPNDVAAINDRLYVAVTNLDAGHTAAGPSLVAVLDAASGEWRRTITLTGRNAVGLAWDEARGWLWALSAGSYEGGGYDYAGKMEAIDPAVDEVVKVIDVDGAPIEGLIVGDLAYLTNAADGRLTVVDVAAEEQLDFIDLRFHTDAGGLSFVSALAMGAGGMLYATDFNSAYLYVIDPAQDHTVIYETLVNDGPDTLVFLP